MLCYQQCLPPFAVPSGPPINISVADSSPSSITVLWLPPDPLDANGAITAYTFTFNRVEAGDFVQLEFDADQLSHTKMGTLFL